VAATVAVGYFVQLLDWTTRLDLDSLRSLPLNDACRSASSSRLDTSICNDDQRASRLVFLYVKGLPYLFAQSGLSHQSNQSMERYVLRKRGKKGAAAVFQSALLGQPVDGETERLVSLDTFFGQVQRATNKPFDGAFHDGAPVLGSLGRSFFRSVRETPSMQDGFAGLCGSDAFLQHDYLAHLQSCSDDRCVLDSLEAAEQRFEHWRAGFDAALRGRRRELQACLSESVKTDSHFLLVDSSVHLAAQDVALRHEATVKAAARVWANTQAAVGLLLESDPSLAVAVFSDHGNYEVLAENEASQYGREAGLNAGFLFLAGGTGVQTCENNGTGQTIHSDQNDQPKQTSNSHQPTQTSLPALEELAVSEAFVPLATRIKATNFPASLAQVKSLASPDLRQQLRKTRMREQQLQSVLGTTFEDSPFPHLFDQSLSLAELVASTPAPQLRDHLAEYLTFVRGKEAQSLQAVLGGHFSKLRRASLACLVLASAAGLAGFWLAWREASGLRQALLLGFGVGVCWLAALQLAVTRERISFQRSLLLFAVPASLLLQACHALRGRVLGAWVPAEAGFLGRLLACVSACVLAFGLLFEHAVLKETAASRALLQSQAGSWVCSLLAMLWSLLLVRRGWLQPLAQGETARPRPLLCPRRLVPGPRPLAACLCLLQTGLQAWSGLAGPDPLPERRKRLAAVGRVEQGLFCAVLVVASAVRERAAGFFVLAAALQTHCFWEDGLAKLLLLLAGMPAVYWLACWTVGQAPERRLLVAGVLAVCYPGLAEALGIGWDDGYASPRLQGLARRLELQAVPQIAQASLAVFFQALLFQLTGASLAKPLLADALFKAGLELAFLLAAVRAETGRGSHRSFAMHFALLPLARVALQLAHRAAQKLFFRQAETVEVDRAELDAKAAAADVSEQ